jgi:DNA-binding NarL/FixJ family response regulator
MEQNIEQPSRILIFDCNRFELATLADSLRLQGIDVVGEATDIATATHLYRALTPDAILINYQGCDGSILQFIHELRTSQGSLGIILLTHSPDLRLFGITEKELPVGTLLIEKSALTDLRELRNAIIASPIAGGKTTWVTNQWDGALLSLTDIQVETLRLLALGLSNSDIGRTRFVSEKSVEQTISRIAQHLHVSHEHGRNMRVILASQYFKWLGAPRNHPLASSA